MWKRGAPIAQGAIGSKIGAARNNRCDLPSQHGSYEMSVIDINNQFCKNTRTISMVAILISIASLLWQVSSVVSPSSIFATRFSLQTPAQSTRMSIHMIDDMPSITWYTTAGELVVLKYDMSQADMPAIRIGRTGDSANGELAIRLPSGRHPYVEIADGSGAATWSTETITK